MPVKNTIDPGEFEGLFINDIPLLDIRSPIEFLRGSFPTSQNLPLLSDVEREQIGKEYKLHGQDSAIRLGHELISASKRDSLVSGWKQHIVAHPDCALYCFRGGLRSRTVQDWLLEEGVNVPLIEGGYKALRRYLIDQLAHLVEHLNYIVIGGRTGSGKTLLLDRLPYTIDLEKLAKHRGSSFGATIESQPSNIDFENALSIELLRLNRVAANSIFLEDEGRMIGRVRMPDSLRNRMPQMPGIILEAPLEYRVEISIDAYVVELLEAYQSQFGAEAGMSALFEHHRSALARIRKRFGQTQHDETLALLNEAVAQHKRGELDGYVPYIAKLLTEYYDPMYDYQLKRKTRPILFSGTADEIVEWVSARDHTTKAV